MKSISDEYFTWLHKFVCNKDSMKKYSEYSKIITKLHSVEYIWELEIEMDENRAFDGIGLRYRFGLDSGYSIDSIQRELDDKPCSLLEMMVALSLKSEEDIIGDPTDLRVDRIFWIMMDNAGLSTLDNKHYSDNVANKIIDRLLFRKYGSNGEGGWFELQDTVGYDLRTLDIWWTLNLYLSENMKGE